MRRIKRTLAMGLSAGVMVSGLVFVAPVRADEPRKIDDCEKIQAADAYNQCLAKFGPSSKLHNLEPEKPGDVKASAAEAAATAGPTKYRGHHRGHGHVFFHRRHR
ncbi:MAG: hypothetical protein ABSA13_08460 [Beijerinckiaceae bacterium]